MDEAAGAARGLPWRPGGAAARPASATAGRAARQRRWRPNTAPAGGAADPAAGAAGALALAPQCVRQAPRPAAGGDADRPVGAPAPSDLDRAKRKGLARKRLSEQRQLRKAQLPRPSRGLTGPAIFGGASRPPMDRSSKWVDALGPSSTPHATSNFLNWWRGAEGADDGNEEDREVAAAGRRDGLRGLHAGR